MLPPASYGTMDMADIVDRNEALYTKCNLCRSKTFNFFEWTKYSSLAEEKQFKHRLGLIDRQWHDQGYFVFSWEKGRTEVETSKIFTEWKVRHGITYNSIAHEERRYTIFKEALHDMDQHNAGYAIGVYRNNRCIDQFTHLTQEEYEAVCCGYWEEMTSEAELQRVGQIQQRLWQAFSGSLI
ncbi:Oryzain alpha chain [Hordeum vulgare]|nr:Oryzain alpha chain [Hordeum vulgare]